MHVAGARAASSCDGCAPGRHCAVRRLTPDLVDEDRFETLRVGPLLFETARAPTGTPDGRNPLPNRRGRWTGAGGRRDRSMLRLGGGCWTGNWLGRWRRVLLEY
jgi:hypothetical protein